MTPLRMQKKSEKSQPTQNKEKVMTTLDEDMIFYNYNTYSNAVFLTDMLPVGQVERARLLNEYSSFKRHYHNLNHLVLMLNMHYAFKNKYPYYMSANDNLNILCAIAYHDVHYDSYASDNEVISAQRWRDDASRQHLSSLENIETVSNLILATENHFNNPDTYSQEFNDLRNWFIGLDLCGLAAPYDRYEMNGKLIRLEYDHLSDDEYAKGRGSFIEMVSKQEIIFKHPVFFKLFEKRARENIERTLHDSKLIQTNR